VAVAVAFTVIVEAVWAGRSAPNKINGQMILSITY